MASPEGEPVEGKYGYEFEADYAIGEYEPEFCAAGVVAAFAEEDIENAGAT